MVDDEPFYSPNLKQPAPRQPEPGELLFEFYVERTHTRWTCELRTHAFGGETVSVEACFLQNEEFFASRNFPAHLNPMRSPREMAIAWAHEERKAIEGL
jgi:hypothetical protein